ncbi:MAG: FAD-binding protein, partial [Nitrospinae bacterium]|nr:FAD-binding protein [Nitrospinota bacterium]
MAEAHHGVGVLYYRMRDGVQAIFHLRAAGNIYKSRTDPQSRKNLLIINGNLEKAYRKFNLDPADFEEIESVKPVSPEERWKATGVGFYIGDKGYLLAPLYALEGSERIRVKSSGGKGTAVRRAQDFTVYDISVLKADRSENTPGQALILGDSAGLKIGDPVFTINYKKLGVGAGKGRVLKGTITALKAIQKDEKMFQIDLPVGEMSGGPLLNSKGERFMERYAPNIMELASGDVVSRSEQTEINEGRGIDGGVLLDVRHLGEKLIRERLSQILDIARDFAGGRLRTTAEQNLLYRWVPEGYLHAFWTALEAIGLSEDGANQITDVVACPGTDSCKMGITSAMGVSIALRKSIRE